MLSTNNLQMGLLALYLIYKDFVKVLKYICVCICSISTNT